MNERMLTLVGLLIAAAGLGNIGLSLWLVSRDAEQALNIARNSERVGRIEAWRDSESDFRRYITDDLRGDLAQSGRDIAALRDLVGRACAKP